MMNSGVPMMGMHKFLLKISGKAMLVPLIYLLVLNFYVSVNPIPHNRSHRLKN